MERLGASAKNIRAFVALAIGDRYDMICFDGMTRWNRISEPSLWMHIARISSDSSLRCELTDDDKKTLQMAIGGDIKGRVSFKLSSLIRRDLEASGVSLEHITEADHSTIIDRYTRDSEQGGTGISYRYHSARRDKGCNGRSLNTSIFFSREGFYSYRKDRLSVP
ncbi:hypothetical protein QBC46DRAFT_421297 [Diplogelasinospora grovesii]|uniref:Uncharacterized protein n=1 Tax=Diplogelasinospora grovesii TaxID=303347 RepID=A0AAN6S0A4_9PEZI|nr:hypothetical protein QBC46DRAFT_421297 [Diplogelasinospora grovesii]